MTYAAVRSALTVAALAWGLAAAQDAPPWGLVPYVAEVAQFVDDAPIGTLLLEVAPEGVRYTARSDDGEVLLALLLTWDGADWTAYGAEPPNGAFEPAFPGFGDAVLAAVVDPRTPEIGACAQEGTTCVEEGEETYGGRRAMRVSLAIEGLGTSIVWVDLATGFTLGGQGATPDVTARTELVRFEERAPDPERLRP
jgi:hypothetical protein